MSGNDPLVMMMLTRRRRSADGTNGNDDDRAATTRCTSSNDPLHGFQPFSKLQKLKMQIARRFRLADPHIEIHIEPQGTHANAAHALRDCKGCKEGQAFCDSPSQTVGKHNPLTRSTFSLLP